MAEIHGLAMEATEAWNAATMQGFLTAPGAVFFASGRGFALGRVTLDEAELLTVAVDPAARRQGTARACLTGFEAEAARRGAARVFLEVARTNTAARALYVGAGYVEDGFRRGYYRCADGPPVDAVLMSKPLTDA